jgi:hypothetical protein
VTSTSETKERDTHENLSLDEESSNVGLGTWICISLTQLLGLFVPTLKPQAAFREGPGSPIELRFSLLL